ncbi:MAG: hypothetical protein ACHQCG_01935 [Solirubrobacterales bacterium]
MTIQMFDTTTPDEVPTGNVEAVAGYVGGHWPTYARLVQDHPQAHHLSIAVNAHEDAQCLDVEAGDATPDEAPAWVRRQQGRGVQRPVVYASLSAMEAVLAALERAGIDRSQVRLWTAHYTGHEHLCTAACGFGFRWTADATQWTDRALKRNLDESVCSDSFFGPPPSPPDPHHYASYPEGPFAWRNPTTGDIEGLNERAIVKEYDHRRVHPQMNAQRLNELRAYITFLRKRVWYVAHHDVQSGVKYADPDWNSYHRGWRWQMLLKRSRGERVA